MIFSLFSNPIVFVFVAVTIVIAITVHEFFHAFAADKLGDPTPRLMGRISLNPMRHLDLFGTIFILLAGFGWGKPVQFDPFNLENPRRDAAIIAVAGPISNFVMAIAGSLLAKGVDLFGGGSFLLNQFLFVFILLNLTLGVFNLIPVHPLDGFKIVGGLLPDEKAHEWYGLERYGFIFLLLMILPLGPGGNSMVDSIIRPIIQFLGLFLFPSVVGS
ncbi:MAG: site-2 protease family protein [Patescibacteria group bacterium]